MALGDYVAVQDVVFNGAFIPSGTVVRLDPSIMDASIAKAFAPATGTQQDASQLQLVPSQGEWALTPI